MTEEEFLELTKKICLGNKDAEDFLFKVAVLYNTWDDLYDKDNEVSSDLIDDVLSDLAFEFSRNEFYRKHRDVLDAQIFLDWQSWQASNHWQNSTDALKYIFSCFLKDCFGIDHIVAWLVGGRKHAKQMNMIIRNRSIKQLEEDIYGMVRVKHKDN